MNFYHYGGAKADVGKDGVYKYDKGTLDMRAGVGLLNRNIRFISDMQDAYSASLVTYYLKKYDEENPEASQYKKGVTRLRNVEFYKMG